MEVLTAVATKIAELLVEPIGQWLRYSFDYDSNIKTMENQVQDLHLTRDSVQHLVDAASRNGEEIEALVTTWLTKVDEITEEARKVVPVEERAHARCSNGACLNLKLRHQLSRKAEKMVQVIGEVRKNGNFERISYRPPPQGIFSTRQMDYMDLLSRISIANKLMEALRDANINMIGVWGMAGAGKTTLVREVARKAKDEKLFDEVALAYVTQSPDHGRIQGEIADMLDLKLDAASERGRAYRLKQRLITTHKKILVILDDLWEVLDLEKIGIPSTGCKVVLTSRDQHLLSCQMGTQKDFGLEVLPENEAWDLFAKMAGDCVTKDPNLRCIATEVAKQCANLPIALATVAKALKNKSLHEWNDALQQLRRPVPGEIIRKQYSTIYSSIELSYSRLESPEVQDFFLRCAEMHYSIDYQDLLKYCYGLSLFEDIDNLEQARDRLHSLVHNLKDKSLLLDCPHGSEHCHMHDVVRYVARFIASRDRNMFVVTYNSGLKKWTEVDALQRCTSFSIHGGDIHELPKEMECPNLRFFHVYGGDHSLQIRETFFEGMGNLQVLDLTNMKFPSLPSSLSLLGNLQTLCLDQCVLGDISVLRELKSLVVLSLLSSDMSQLPREIGFLTRLRLLDLSNCPKLEVIPPNVLSKLVELEELYMGNSLVQWEAEGLANERKNASLAELKHLSRLITLEIQIRDVNNLPKHLLFEKLKSYAICVGDHVWDSSSDKRKASRTLKLKLNTSFQAEVGITMLLKRTEALYLDELMGVKSLLNELDREGFRQLKHLHIQNNPEIKYIINLRISVVAFPALETFILKNMMSLEEIFHGQLPLTSFYNLRIVKVEHCDKLKFVFSSFMARGLSQLEELEVRECSMMGAIVMKEGEIEDTDAFLFPQLRRLALEHLPKLISFLSTQNPLIADVGEINSEGKLDFHKPILHEQVVFPILETLELSSVNLAEIEQAQHPARSSCRLANIQAMSRFENLSYLEVKGSGNIKYILSFSTARFMVQLKHLHVRECEVVEEILAKEELGVVEEITQEPKVVFPRLECLFLQKLPTLKRFCVGSNIEFQSLKNLMIANCPKLETFIMKSLSSGMTTSKELMEMSAEESPHSVMQLLFDQEVVFPNSETLELSSVNLVEIEQTQHPARSSCRLANTQAMLRFKNLSRLEVTGLGNIKYILSFSTARFMVQLKHLHVGECEVVEEILVTEELGVVEEITQEPNVVFPQLECLFLQKLPTLKRFCMGSNIEFQSLKQLNIENCPKLETFISKSLSSSMTTSKELKEMSAEESPHSVMQLLFNQEVVFPILETLELSLLNLAEIEQTQHLPMSRFENLSSLEVTGLGNIKYILSFSTARFMVQLKHLHVVECEVVEEILDKEELGVVEEITQEPKVVFPQLECLFLQKLPTLKRFCMGSNIEFQSLKKLRIENCPKLETFISKPLSSGMTTSKGLKEMSAEESPHPVLQPLFNEGVAFPSLERLIISHVDCLKIIWKNQFTINCFCKLQFIKVEFCENLMNIFHSDMLTRFESVETLTVANCGVEEIVAGEKGGEAIARFVFPRITQLSLQDLPRLKWFYRGMHASEWPMLKNLTVNGCEKFDIFASHELLSFQETVEESQVEISIKEPLFLVDKATFPNLEFLTLTQYDTIWRGQFLEECFCKLKVLELTSNHNESDVSPPNFVNRLHNLEKLVVHHSSWEEIFPYEVLIGQEKHAGILTQLRELNLNEFPKLTHLWNEDTQPCPILQNLEILKVSECGKLNILVPSSVSFQNLAELEILKCRGLINLVTSSTAKSLVQLKKMSVSECETITEIVRGEGGEANEVITFSKLTSLKLDCLPQLSNFCLGGYSFEFPSLEEVIVSQCQEMKAFSHSVLSTPKLKRVQATKEDEGHWKDDLNTTIHWLSEGRLKERSSKVQNSEEDKDHP